MLFPLIKDILELFPGKNEVTVRGWVRTKRDMKNLIFVEVNDGSCFNGIQCTFNREDNLPPETDELLTHLSTGSSVIIKGNLVPSPASGQKVEIQSLEIEVIGEAPVDTYPLQKKRHSLEFLRENAHLRARTNTFGAVTRVRNRLAFAVHEFFQKNNFQYIHAPIITGNDAEGAGELFQVTTLDLNGLAK